MINPSKRSISFLSILLCMVFSGVSQAADHLIAIAHDYSATKAITVYEPDGTLVYTYVTSGGPTTNTPTFIRSIPEEKRFIVACPNGGSQTGGIVEVFDYSSYPLGPITHVQTLTSGNRPFHAAVTPDNLFIVANDGDDSFTLIDPLTLSMETISAGEHHLTFAFAGDAASYDIYVGRFDGANPGGPYGCLLRPDRAGLFFFWGWHRSVRHPGSRVGHSCGDDRNRDAKHDTPVANFSR